MALVEKYEGKRHGQMPEKLTLAFFIVVVVSKINSILRSVAGTQTRQVSL